MKIYFDRVLLLLNVMNSGMRYYKGDEKNSKNDNRDIVTSIRRPTLQSIRRPTSKISSGLELRPMNFEQSLNVLEERSDISSM